MTRSFLDLRYRVLELRAIQYRQVTHYIDIGYTLYNKGNKVSEGYVGKRLGYYTTRFGCFHINPAREPRLLKRQLPGEP